MGDFMDTNLALGDWIVLCFYAAFVIYIGWYTGRQEKNTEDFFLGGRRMPWWAVMISIYATSLSALTFIGVPGAAYNGDFHYLQLGIGDFLGRVLICFLLLTAYYRGRVTTVYEFLGQRFGPRSRDAGTLFFIVTRLLASGVRLAGCALALAMVFNLPINTAIFLIALTALAYTMVGGIKAVIWTDMLQFILFIGAAVVALGMVMYSLPNGWNDFVAIGSEHDKFRIFHISFDVADKDYWLNFGNPQALMAGFLFGCFGTFAALGTDQDLVQRMLTCEKVQQSQRALLLTAILNFPITLLFLSVGAALFVYYQVFPNEIVNQYAQTQPDKIFPFFIKEVLPQGLRGLLIAGLIAAAMSSLDSALNALASTAYVDIFQRYIRSKSTDAQAVWVSRIFVVVFAVLLTGIAMLFSKTSSILWLGFKIVGYTYGALLGIFLLAVLTRKRGNDIVNVIAMVTSVLLVIFLTTQPVASGHVLHSLYQFRSWLFSCIGLKSVAWPWAIVIGTCWTFGVACIFSTSSVTNVRKQN